MLPSLPPGTLLLLDHGSQPATVCPGDVVALQGATGERVAHRVVALRDGGCVTRGDNRPTPDGFARRESIEGRVLFTRIPGGSWRRPQRMPRGRHWYSRPGRSVLGLAMRIGKYLDRIRMKMDRFEIQKIGREVAVHDRETGQVHLLNATASFVWMALRRGSDKASIVRELASRHPGVPSSQIEADVAEVMGALREKTLLHHEEKRGSSP